MLSGLMYHMVVLSGLLLLMLQPAPLNVASVCILAVVSPVPPWLPDWPLVCVSQKLLLTVPPTLFPTSPPTLMVPVTAPVA